MPKVHYENIGQRSSAIENEAESQQKAINLNMYESPGYNVLTYIYIQNSASFFVVYT